MMHTALVLLMSFAMFIPAAARETKPAEQTKPAPAKPVKPVKRAPPPAKPQPKSRAVYVRVSGNVGRTTFAASKSFDAVLGTASGVTYGGGAGVIIRENLFIDVDATRFTHAGQRVFIGPDNQRYSLGIPMHITTTPLDISAGWRVPVGGNEHKRRSIHNYELAPYVGGGIGVLKYEETSKFAQPGDNVDKTFTSYHVLAGADAPIVGGLGVNLDVLYRWVPHAIGTEGVSRVFGEKDLGGATIRLKFTYLF
jgi:opacity protein-like surface antigen